MTVPDFVEPTGSPPQVERPPIAPENLRVRQPTPGPDETCDEYTNRQLKEVCGKPATSFVSLPGSHALPEGVRIALCDEHRALHDARHAARRTQR